MNERVYKNASAFMYALGNAKNPKAKNAPHKLCLGFVDGDIWHQISIKYIKGREDVKEVMMSRLGKFIVEKAEK